MLSSLESFVRESVSCPRDLAHHIFNKRLSKSEDECMQESYSLPASLALLRIYVTQPDKTDIKLIAQLLVKAMMRLPNTDFSTLLHLIPERIQVMQNGPGVSIHLKGRSAAFFLSFLTSLYPGTCKYSIHICLRLKSTSCVVLHSHL